MKKAKAISAIVLPVLLVVAILAVSAYAKGKPPKPEPIEVSITGDITGVGDPATMAIDFGEGDFTGLAAVPHAQR